MSESTSSFKPISGGKPRCLVIQLGRTTDILQSLMALRAVNQLYPDLELHLVVRESFSAAVKSVTWLSSVTTLPTHSLVQDLLKEEITEDGAISEVARWMTPLIEKPWDFVINWSYTEASSYLTRLIPSRIKLGFSRNRSDDTLSSVDGWSHYTQAIVQGGIAQNIHLTDILTTQLLTALQIHMGAPKDCGDAAVTSKSFFQYPKESLPKAWMLRDHSTRWIGIQPGARKKGHTLSPTQWRDVCAAILENNPDLGIVLLGDPAEKKQYETLFESLSYSDRLINLTGETSFSQWVKVISQCQWLMSGNTSAIHMASLLGTRVFCIAPRESRWWENGPYGNGHYILSNKEGTDFTQSLNSQAVCDSFEYAISEWSHQRNVSFDEYIRQTDSEDHFLSNIRVYRSRIRSTEDGGGVHYEPLQKKSTTLTDWTASVMGYIARGWYCGWTPPVGNELKRDHLSVDLIQNLRQLSEALEVMEKLSGEAAQTAAELKLMGRALKSEKLMQVSDKQKVEELGRRIIEIDRLIDRVCNAHPSLSGFSRIAHVMMHNLKGDLLSELGQESESTYRQLGSGITMMKAWIKYTLGLSRPVAITTEAETHGTGTTTGASL